MPRLLKNVAPFFLCALSCALASLVLVGVFVLLIKVRTGSKDDSIGIFLMFWILTPMLFCILTPFMLAITAERLEASRNKRALSWMRVVGRSLKMLPLFAFLWYQNRFGPQSVAVSAGVRAATAFIGLLLAACALWGLRVRTSDLV